MLDVFAPDPPPEDVVIEKLISNEQERTMSFETNGTNGHATGSENGHFSETSQKGVKLLRSECVQATLLILANSSVAEGLLTYANGWNDERIASVLQQAPGREGIGVRHIRDLRRESLGWLPAEREKVDLKGSQLKGYSDPVKVMRKIEALERRIEQLEAAVTSPEK